MYSKSSHLPSFNSQLGSPLSGFSGGHDLYSFHHNTNRTPPPKPLPELSWAKRQSEPVL
jgi:hypothetical protein